MIHRKIRSLTSSPLGEAIFTTISVMSKLERVKGGLRKSRDNGKWLGRPESEAGTDKIVE